MVKHSYKVTFNELAHLIFEEKEAMLKYLEEESIWSYEFIKIETFTIPQISIEIIDSHTHKNTFNVLIQGVTINDLARLRNNLPIGKTSGVLARTLHAAIEEKVDKDGYITKAHIAP